MGAPPPPPPSYLIDETSKMNDERRAQEQQWQRQFGIVHTCEHAHEAPAAAPSASAEAGQEELAAAGAIQDHPFLNKQIYDGADPDVNRAPPLNTKARLEYDNALREQRLEAQLRLGNSPKMGNTPKPQPS